MATGIQINRSNIDLPVDVAQEIMQKTQESSAVMQLAKQIALPGRGAAINVITSDPEAAWVAETGAKAVSRPGLATKVMRAYKLAVIVPFSEEFTRDAKALYDACISRLPGALAKTFDNTVFGNEDAPGSDFDTFASCTASSLSSDVYAGLVAADTDIATHGGILNGWVISPQGKGILLGATDTTKRPLFINNVSEGAVPMILGSKTVLSKAAFKNASPAVIGFAGDWTQAMYGTVEGVKIDLSKEATIVDNDTTISMFQNNMIAVRAEIEVGFRADTSVFNKLTSSSASF